jgi:ribonuclease-3 family protein
VSLPEQDRTKQGSTASAQTWAEATIRINLSIADNFSKIEQLSPVALAYIGDAVYELYIRTRYLMPPTRVSDYHSRVVAQVRAETQAAYVEMLQPHFTASEKEILRRGRNAAGGKPRRLSKKIYQQASSLETLIGYLYLSDPQRLTELLTKLELK